MLPQGFIQDLLSRVDVVEVVGRQVELKKAGINHKGLCPFHGEKSPSFIVSPSRQTYHCFGCGAHGDAIRFLTEQGGLSFMDAVRELAQQAGLAMPENRASPDEQARAAAERAQRGTLTEVLTRADQHFRQTLKGDARAVAYLRQRGLDGATAARFGLGYSPEGWRTLAGVFPSYDDPLLVDAGLVILHEAEEGTDAAQAKRYDRFRDRIMFPIRSVRGEVIGFGGRVLDKGEPKYLNSPETAVFHKGQELYGLFEARQALRERGFALVVEGYMDVVALAQSGFGNAVATLGTACTAEHLAKLFRFTDSVVFSFDGDAAGRRAAARALEAALPHASDARSVRFLFLPTEHDPDSYVRELGAPAFEAQIAQAVPLSTQLLSHAAQECDLGSAEGRAKMLTQARPLLAQLPAGLLREQLIAELAQRGGVPLETLQAHWARQPPTRRALMADEHGERPSAARRRAAPSGRTPPQTATLLDRAAWLLARHAGQWHELSADVHELLAGQPAPYGPFFTLLERALNEHGPMQMPALLAELSQGEDAEFLAPLLARLSGFHEVEDSADAHSAILAAVWQLRVQALDVSLGLLASSGELSPTEMDRYRALNTQRSALRNAKPAQS